jgi:hypothetical protein
MALCNSGHLTFALKQTLQDIFCCDDHVTYSVFVLAFMFIMFFLYSVLYWEETMQMTPGYILVITAFDLLRTEKKGKGGQPKL